MLRITGFGSDYPLFIKSEQFNNYSQPNPDIIQRYFANSDAAPDVSPDTEFFKSNKLNGTFRIVVQGGSTAAGFPYGRWGSIKGMLDQRFKRLYPNTRIEIINTSMSAVNSYTLLDFSDEIIQLQPDLILIYAGHNEYLGIMGVGSAYASQGGRAATLMFLKFRNLRLYQLIEMMFYSKQKSSHRNLKNKTLMAQIAKEKTIPYQSELYQAGIEQFSGNLSMLLKKYQQHNIPVMISTLISNEKDQPPFSSIGKINWDSFNKQLINTPLTTQLEQLKQQFSLSKSAEDAYKIAQLLVSIGNTVEARGYYKKSLDLDQLRFRAPTAFNKIIREKAKQYHSIVVDAESYFVANSSFNIPGSDLVLEHLHPNTTGYFYLAKAFSDAIIANGFLGKVVNHYPDDFALADIPISKSDRLFAEYKISKLKSGYPFKAEPIEIPTPTGSSIETIALLKRLKGETWLSLQQQLLVQYQKNNEFAEAAKIASLICDALPEQHQTAYIAGQLYFKVNDIQLALYYHQLANRISPGNSKYLLALAQDFYTINEFQKSLQMLQRVLAIDPKQKSALFFTKKIKRQLSRTIK